MIGIHQRPAVALGLARSSWRIRVMMATSLTCLLAGCAIGTSQGPPPRSPEPTASKRPTPNTRELDARQAERLKHVMLPLIQHMNKPLPLNQVRVGIMDDPKINAANAGGGEFYVTTGLLELANDDQLRGVLAHEVAHADLGHVAQVQMLGAGLNIGMIILDQFIPGSGKITPLIADLGVMRPFSRKEEYEADAHGVDILRRSGYDGKQIMSRTLTWLLQTSGPSGGFFATHPGTEDRIQRVHNLP